MHLNHLDLQVTCVAQSVDFFERIFGLELRSNRRSPAIAILGDGAGFVLVLQRREAVVYPEGFHVGFLVDALEQVHAAHARATAAGLDATPVESDSRSTRFYCRAPDGYAVEVGCPRSRGA